MIEAAFVRPPEAVTLALIQSHLGQRHRGFPDEVELTLSGPGDAPTPSRHQCIRRTAPGLRAFLKAHGWS